MRNLTRHSALSNMTQGAHHTSFLIIVDDLTAQDELEDQISRIDFASTYHIYIPINSKHLLQKNQKHSGESNQSIDGVESDS